MLNLFLQLQELIAKDMIKRLPRRFLTKVLLANRME